MSIADIHRRYAGVATVDHSDEAALESLHSESGFTRHALTGESPPPHGYMVSLHPKRGGDEEIHPLNEITAQHIADHRRRARHDATARGMTQHFYQGGWVHNGNAYLDRSLHITQRDRAELMGEQHKQLAIWDLANQKEIPLGK